tara:strand:+ start:7759 stop:9324 length:1566 start_codon:yes stop_codon:yes gene_type:complete
MNLEHILIFIFLILYFLLLFRISYFFVGKGSDHKFYEHYTDTIKKNGNKFFSYFPNFLNKMPIYDPQFFFKLISYLPKDKLSSVAFLLNPVLIFLILIISILFYSSTEIQGESNFFILSLIFLISFTPQYFHQQNSRIYGLSVRGIGLLLILIFFISIFFIENTNNNFIFICVAFIASYLIWGSNLFAQQIIIIFPFLWFLLFGDYTMIIISISSLVFFYLIHGKYSKIFITTRIRNWEIYYSILAEKFLFSYRDSIWKDWIYDFWFKKFSSLKSRLSYIYTNSFFIIIFLNPLLILAIYSFFNPLEFQDKYLNSIYIFSTQISLIGFLTSILTSFRFSRFLGEPERYVEAVIPFSSFVSCLFLYSLNTFTPLYILFFYFFILNIFQISTFVFLRKFHKQNISIHLNKITVIIENKRKDGMEIRFTSNNMDWTKLLLNTEWKFVNYIPAVYNCGSIHLKDLIINYPFMTPNSFNKIYKEFNLNFILLDKTIYPDYNKFIIENKKSRILLEEKNFLLIELNT